MLPSISRIILTTTLDIQLHFTHYFRRVLIVLVRVSFSSIHVSRAESGVTHLFKTANFFKP